MKGAVSIGTLSLFFLLIEARSQVVPKTEVNMEAFVEALFAIQEEDLDYEDLYESLLQVYLNPLNLNQATAEELQSLYILQPIQINSLLDYIQTYGKLLSLYELQAVPEFDLETIYRLLPFVMLEDGEGKANRPFIDRVWSEKNGYFMVRHRRFWQTRKGFTPPDTLSGGRLSTRYQGDPHDLYVRFRVQHAKDFSLGFTMDKDAGEEFIWDRPTKRYGFNFISYHFTLYEKGKWKTLTLGDYRAQFGQGLVFGSGFSAGKGAETITTVRRSSTGFRPYTSAMEYGFFRGAAATYSWKNLEASTLYSDAPRDGNLESTFDTLENREEHITALLLSGYHRTPTEIANKAAAREQNIGANLTYKNLQGSLQLGMNTLFTSYSEPFIRTERIYNGFEFRGKSNHIHSAFFSYNFQNYFFFGETARSKSGGTGTVMGMMASLAPHLDLSVLWRTFDRNFHSFYGNAFSEGSRPINESGLYLGLQYRASSAIHWSGYFDRFHFPWLRFRAYAPSDGHEWLNRITYSPSRQMRLMFQIREEVKERNLAAADQPQPGYRLASGRKRNYATSLDLTLDKRWSIRSRIQFSSYSFNGSRTKGYAILQDLNGDLGKFRVGGRIALFDTDDYDNRQYIYERNVLWAFSIPNMNGQGMRVYLLAQYNINRKLTFWARWAKTTYTDRNEIGSGLQQVQGNVLTETTFQLRYEFNQ